MGAAPQLHTRTHPLNRYSRTRCGEFYYHYYYYYYYYYIYIYIWLYDGLGSWGYPRHLQRTATGHPAVIWIFGADGSYKEIRLLEARAECIGHGNLILTAVMLFFFWSRCYFHVTPSAQNSEPLLSQGVGIASLRSRPNTWTHSSHAQFSCRRSCRRCTQPACAPCSGLSLLTPWRWTCGLSHTSPWERAWSEQTQTQHRWSDALSQAYPQWCFISLSIVAVSTQRSFPLGSGCYLFSISSQVFWKLLNISFEFL